ncbi:ROK family protein [Priestia megaterium]|uniref:ROK family protein n=1 Tax=Priestia megaterium TaxID=1404 RepID=UPI0021D695F5|nr:ROK family protein [Priestia megaterium]MCU7766933.1 ROK family protein [Priestia megaterium]
MSLNCYIAIDIGGTAIKYGIVNQIGSVLMNEEIPTNAKDGADTVINRIIDHIHPFFSVYKPSGIAISTAGQVDIQKGTITYAGETLPGYKNYPLKEVFEKVFNLPVSVDNDVNCALLGEKWLGTAKNETECIMLTIGTGIGGAILLDGNLYRGRHFAAGEWGYMWLRESSFEQLASTSALINQVETALDLKACSLNGKKVFELMDHNQSVVEIINQFFTNLAKGIANIIFILDIEKVIVGGGISENKYFLKYLNRYLNEYLPAEVQNRIILENASLGNKAGFIGAVSHHLNTYKKREF